MQNSSKIFQEYFSEIKKEYSRGDFTEMTFRTALENFVEKFNNDYDLSEEPGRKRGFGAPDFKAFRKSIKIGYIETKDLNVDLYDNIESEQIERYKRSINNIIFTNYYKFILIRNNEKIFDLDLFSLDDLKNSKFKAADEKISEFVKMLDVFFSFKMPTIKSAEELAKELSRRTKLLREIAKEQLEQDKQAKGEELPSPIFYFYQGINELINDISTDDCADAYAQTITYGLFLSKLKIKKQKLEKETASLYIPQSIMIIKKIFRNVSEGLPVNITWIIDEIIDILNACDIEKVMENIDKRLLADRDPFSFFYEDFLEKYDPEKRKSLGVYFTPRPVVNFIVKSINFILKHDFKKLNGYADDDVTVLDPATGTATFLYLVYIQSILELRNKGLGGLVNKKIEKHLLKDFYGFEIQIAAYIFAHLKLAATLDQYHYKLKDKDRTQIYLTNTLEPSESHGLIPFMKELNEESIVANKLKKEKKILVLLSNPPYKSMSINNSEWIRNLLRGYTIDDTHIDEGYYQVDGEPLGEKNPKWLQDDYVKFIRFAQWKIDSAGDGVIGYITNHSYLDNATFRGMRRSLMKSFNRIYILNLHGDVRKREKTPKGAKDENVFESITQGVAISIFIKSNKFSDNKVYYSDLWGKRLDKFAWLDRHNALYSSTYKTGNDVEWEELNPVQPNYFFVHKDLSFQSEYQKFWGVKDIFKSYTSAIVTARDKLTIKWNSDEIFETVTKFSQLESEAIKKEFNVKDSVDWQIDRARNDLNESGPDESNVVPILYRPFDVRFTYYTGRNRGFIGRPRFNVMRNMLRKNFGLITRRQMQEPFNFVFVSDMIISDGVIRSDNKGVESLFPLYVYPDDDKKQSNINSELIDYLQNVYGKKISVEEVFNYIYGVLYSEKYRQRYSEFLGTNFPRIPFVKKYETFVNLSNLGNKLVSLHTLQEKFETETRFNVPGDSKITNIKYSDNKIYINEKQFFESIPKDIWSFSIGTHNVLQKWLKSRLGRILEVKEIEKFLQIVEIIRKTLDCMEKIDKLNFLPK